MCCLTNEGDCPAAFRVNPKALRSFYSPKCYFVNLDGFLSFPLLKYFHLGIPKLKLISNAEFSLLYKTSVCSTDHTIN